jgi:hypothetical protein
MDRCLHKDVVPYSAGSGTKIPGIITKVLFLSGTGIDPRGDRLHSERDSASVIGERKIGGKSGKSGKIVVR